MDVSSYEIEDLDDVINNFSTKHLVNSIFCHIMAKLQM